MKNSALAKDASGFYALPDKMEDLIAVAFPFLTRLEHKSIAQLIDEPHITADHLNFLKPAQIASVLAAIELGRRLWKRPVVVRTVIGSPADAYVVFAELLRGKREEHFAIIFLNTKNEIIGREIVSIGTEVETMVPIQKIMRLAVLKSCKLIVAHNHPTGSLEPSCDDIAVTERLLKACELLDISLLDHLIVTDQQFISLRQTHNELSWR